jgi:hypothetical protein
MTMTKAFLAVACMLGAVACGSSDGGVSTSTEANATSCNAAADVGAPPANAMARRVSFASDVLPIFVTSCAFGECHGSVHGRNNGVFLGARPAAEGAVAANDAKAIRASLVGQASTEVPSMPYVTPSDPSRSFLFRKLEGDMCGLAECSGSSACGLPMPRGGDKLDPASLEIVRSWIAQGAPDS